MSTKKLALEQQEFDCQSDESVLDALLRQGVDIPHSCKQGICQACLVRCTDGEPPAAAQQGLKEVQQQQGYFFACQCFPTQDMAISLKGSQALFSEATVGDKAMLNDDTLQLTLQCPEPMDFYAGQFVNLRREDGLTRSYSIANSRSRNDVLILHIRRLAGGLFSEWAHRELQVGDRIQVSAAQGLCYYLPGNHDQNLLLIGTGSGLAPLAGIVSEALEQGHRGNIHLYHGSQTCAGLYWVEEMQQLAAKHPNFHYVPCVSRSAAPAGMAEGRATQVALNNLSDLRGWRVYLCGHPDMVNDAKRNAFLQGASFQDIHSDAFYVTS